MGRASWRHPLCHSSCRYLHLHLHLLLLHLLLLRLIQILTLTLSLSPTHSFVVSWMACVKPFEKRMLKAQTLYLLVQQPAS